MFTSSNDKVLEAMANDPVYARLPFEVHAAWRDRVTAQLNKNREVAGIAELTCKLQTAQANERYWMSRYDTVCGKLTKAEQERDEALAGLDCTEKAFVKAREALNYLTEHSKAELSRVIAERENLRAVAAGLCDEKIAVLKQLDEAREQRDAMCDSAKFWENRFDVCGSQLKKVEMERNSLKGQLEAAEQELKIMRNSIPVMTLEEERNLMNAKAADATLDSLNPNDFGAETRKWSEPVTVKCEQTSLDPKHLDARVSRLEHWLKDFVSVKKVAR